MLCRNGIVTSMLLGLLLGCGDSTGPGELINEEENPHTSNTAPLLSLDSSFTAYGKQSLTLSINTSDEDGSIASVEWQQAEEDPLQLSGELTDNDSLLLTFPDTYTTQTLHFQVTVTDDDGAQTTRETSVSLLPAEHTLALALQGFGQSIRVTDQANETLIGLVTSDYALKTIEVTNLATSEVLNVPISTYWQTEVSLVEGDNALVISAISADDTRVTFSTTVTYAPGLDFTTALEFDTDLIYVGSTTTSIRAMIGSKNDTGRSMKLLDASTNQIAIMSDDGVLPDEIEGDGIFTGEFTLSANTEDRLCFRVQATDATDSTYLSESQCIWARNAYSETQIDAAVALADGVQDDVEELLQQGMDRNSAAEQVVALLQNNADVNVAGATPEGGIWWVSQNGLLGLYHNLESDSKSGANRGGSVAKPPVVNAPFMPNYYRANPLNLNTAYLKPERLAKALAAVGTENRILSTQALIISPFINNPNVSSATNFYTNDDYYHTWQSIQSAQSCQLAASTERINNASINISLDSFKQLSQYGYIHISTHGDNYYNGLLSLWLDEWGPSDFLKGSLSQVALYTGIVLPKTWYGSYVITGYETDLQMKRLAIGPGGLLTLLPDFFTHYLTSLPNSLVVLSSCRSLYNHSLANALLAKGAGAILGFDDYVLSSYAQNTTNSVISAMLNSDVSFSEAVQQTVATYGSSDNGPDNAYLQTAGALDLQLSDGTFSNLDFELGELGVWATQGDGRVLTQLGATLPYGGNYSALVSTGLGYTTDAGEISQSACLAASRTQLQLSWNLFSEEFLEYCHSAYDDTFSVSMCEYNTSNCQTFSTSISEQCSAAGLTTADISFDKGDVYSTGWQTQTLDISTLAGKKVTLSIATSDVGDSIYDTAVMVDDISVE